MWKLHHSSKGLSLLELLVTVGVIAIVAVIAIPAVNNIIPTTQERAAEEAQNEVNDFVSRWNDSGAYTYDPATNTFTGYVDLNGNGTVDDGEESEQLTVDGEEYRIGASAGDAPTDSSGVDFDSTPADSFVVSHQTEPDTDADGFSDSYETATGSDPAVAASTPSDSDGDGYSNTVETDAGSDPAVAASTPLDLDGDGYSNSVETASGSDPNDATSLPDTTIDSDGDGYSDVQELAGGSDPSSTTSIPVADADSDQWSDFAETTAGSDPNDGTSVPVDLDGDGWLNDIETFYGSDPNDGTSVPVDSDNDGSPDSEETSKGTDPFNAASTPTTRALLVSYVDGFNPEGVVVGAALVTNPYGSELVYGAHLGGTAYRMDFTSGSVPIGDAREIIIQMSAHPSIEVVEPDSVVGTGGGGFGGGMIRF